MLKILNASRNHVRSLLFTSSSTKKSGFHSSGIRALETEPDYLKFLKPAVPVYEKLNIQMKCFDFTVLEHYGRYVHRTAVHMDIDVKDAWATPHEAWKVTNIEANSTKVTAEYQLNSYERNVQVLNLPAYSAQLFFEVIRAALPEGVTVSILPHEQAHEDIRYVPDFELIDLKEQLKELNEFCESKK